MDIVTSLKLKTHAINDKLKGTYLNKIQCLGEYDYIFTFSKSKNFDVFISLNVKNPFLRINTNK